MATSTARAEVFDARLQNVFAFDSHRDLDDDRALISSQRIEVKTAPVAPTRHLATH